MTWEGTVNLEEFGKCRLRNKIAAKSALSFRPLGISSSSGSVAVCDILIVCLF